MLNLQPDVMALFLDFDGTLVDIAPRPDAVVVPGGLAELLARLAESLDGALAVVSGRPIAELDAFLAPTRLTAAGLHGLEIRVGDRVERMAAPSGLQAVRSDLIAAPEAAGLRIEDKGLSIALHYRHTPERADAVRGLAEGLARPHPDLSVLHGKMVVEIKPRAASKASALARLMAEPPFAGRCPVFVGDDVTDEDGMRAALERGGTAVKIGAGDTCAPHRLPDPAALLAWLARPAIPGEGLPWDA